LNELPKMLKMELLGVSFHTCSVNAKNSLANQLLKLLGVSQKEGTKDFVDEFILFVNSNFKNLTPEEIYYAYEKAITGELRDFKNEIILIYQKLDNVQTGRVLSAYLEHKRKCEVTQRAKEKLKKIIMEQNKKELTPEDSLKSRIDFLKKQYEWLKVGTKVLGLERFIFDQIVAKYNKRPKWELIQTYLMRFEVNKKTELIPTNSLCFIKESYAMDYIEFHNLKSKTLDEWLEYWL